MYILDLAPRSRQPLVSAGSRYGATYKREICDSHEPRHQEFNQLRPVLFNSEKPEDFKCAA